MNTHVPHLHPQGEALQSKTFNVHYSAVPPSFTIFVRLMDNSQVLSEEVLGTFIGNMPCIDT